MREYRYEDLLDIPYSRIMEITSVPERFTIYAGRKAGQRILRLLENEKVFASSDKSFVSRLKYLKGGLVGTLIPNFMPLWNRAMMDGFVFEKSEQSDSLYKFIFVPR